jgi:hypothetical protein
MMQSSTVSGVDFMLAAAAARAKARAEKARNDYRQIMIVNLVELDRQILQLRVKARTAMGQNKERLYGSLKSIADRRDRFATDLHALDGTPTSVWTAAKTTLERALEELKASVDQAG